MAAQCFNKQDILVFMKHEDLAVHLLNHHPEHLLHPQCPSYNLQ